MQYYNTLIIPQIIISRLVKRFQLTDIPNNYRTHETMRKIFTYREISSNILLIIIKLHTSMKHSVDQTLYTKSSNAFVLPDHCFTTFTCSNIT